jgi:hypothetical protein
MIFSQDVVTDQIIKLNKIKMEITTFLARIDTASYGLSIPILSYLEESASAAAPPAAGGADPGTGGGAGGGGATGPSAPSITPTGFSSAFISAINSLSQEIMNVSYY